MAQRLFLQSTADVLRTMKADDAYILDVFKIITETLAITSSPDSDDSGNSSSSGSQNNYTAGCASFANEFEVFDRNEANIFAEPLKAIMDCVVVFKNTFNERPKVEQFVNSFKVN